jgi:hypothetical protein
VIVSHDPAKEPCSAEYHNPENCMICGPAGNTNVINQNEKGILEKAVHSVPMETAALAATHVRWTI